MKVVIGFDGSSHAGTAASAIRALGEGHLEISIVQGQPPAPLGLRKYLGTDRDSDEHTSGISFSSIVERIRGIRPDAKITTQVIKGHPGDVIVDEAKRTAADLIIVGRRGHSEVKQLFLGSVSLNVIHSAPCPVLVIQDEVAGASKIMCAADGSDSSIGALRWICQEGRLAKDATFYLKTINEQQGYFGGQHSILTPELDKIFSGYYEDSAKQARMILEQAFPAEAIDSEVYTGTHPPATYLLECADKIQPDIILMGYRGLGAVSRFFTGSVTHTIISGSSWNVLIVPGP